MTKAVKANFLKSSWILISIFLFCCLIACGGSADSGTTTDSGVQISSIAASPSSLAGGRSSIITVTVTDSTGAAVSGETVTFSFATTPPSGATLPLNTGTTDAGGKAIGVYTAGTTGSNEVDDIVQATCGSATALVSITRTAGVSVGSNQVNLTADLTSLAATQSTILTATVTDSSNIAVPGATVAFAFATGGNNSGATDPPVMISGTTDASGRAYAIYTAGSLLPSSDLQDILTATAGTVTGPLTITRTSQSTSTTVTPGYNISLSASVSTLAAGEQSIITATVNNSTGNPVSGLTVNFAYVNKNSDSNTSTGLTPFSGITDVSGRVSTVYTAGAAGSPGSTVQDSIKATATDGTYSSTDAIIITRTGVITSGSGYIVKLTPTPTSLAAGQSSILVAQVNDYSGAVVSGKQVDFKFVTINSGATMQNFSGTTVSTVGAILAGGTTDSNGQVMVLYTAGTSSPGTSVQDVVHAKINDSAENSAAIITRLANTGKGNSLSLFIGTSLGATATTYTLPTATSDCIVIAKVVSTDGVTPVSGATVNFSILVPSSGGGTLGATATTGTDGVAYVTYTGPGGATAGDAVIQASTTGGVGVGMVFWSATAP